MRGRGLGGEDTCPGSFNKSLAEPGFQPRACLSPDAILSLCPRWESENLRKVFGEGGGGAWRKRTPGLTLHQSAQRRKHPATPSLSCCSTGAAILQANVAPRPSPSRDSSDRRPPPPGVGAASPPPPAPVHPAAAGRRGGGRAGVPAGGGPRRPAAPPGLAPPGCP